MRMDRLMSIQNLERAPSDFEHTGEDWREFALAWVHLTRIDEKEVIRAKSQESVASHRAVIRFVEGVTTEMRLVDRMNVRIRLDQNRIFHIESIAGLDNRDDYLVLRLIEGG